MAIFVLLSSKCHLCRVFLAHVTFSAVPLHFVQGKRGGLRCCVPPGLQQLRISPIAAIGVCQIGVVLVSFVVRPVVVTSSAQYGDPNS